MVRAMYSGVAGMKVQQQKMDTIGNNIANVGTHGYKASRMTFRDVYYQTNMAATAATGGSGGRNAIQIGVGAKTGSNDVNHAQSVMTTTGFGLDVAIAGEGYLQVQDRNGNIFYTKAGMLDLDEAGNLVDINGNFVLGRSGDPYTQEPGSDRIQVILPNADAKAASRTQLVHNKMITISSTAKTELANVSITFKSSNNLPLNSRAQATVSSDNVVIEINENEVFNAKGIHYVDPTGDEWYEQFNAAGASTGYLNAATGATALAPPAGSQLVPAASWLDDFMEAVNDALNQAYGGNSPLGDIKIEIDDPVTMNKTSYKASDIISSTFDYDQGGIAQVRWVDFPNATGTGTHKGMVDFYGNETTDVTQAVVDFVKDATMPGAWGAAGFRIVGTGSSFGEQFDTGSTDRTLNRGVADVKGMSIQRVDMDGDGTDNGINDGLEFKYELIDTAGNIFTYSYKATNESLKNGGSMLLKLTSAQDSGGIPIAFTSSSADSIELAFPKYDKIISTVKDSNPNYLDRYSLSVNPATGAVTNGVGGVFWDANGNNVNDDAPVPFRFLATDPTRSLGFGNTPFQLRDGTSGGPQGASDCTDFKIDDRGIFSAIGPDGIYREFGRIDLATFNNPRGLTQVGNTYFAVSQNSGEPKLAMPGTEGTGKIIAGTLETSNVDLSNEFSDMIVTQRGFQANSRIITVSDSMIEELVNLKR